MIAEARDDHAPGDPLLCRAVRLSLVFLGLLTALAVAACGSSTKSTSSSSSATASASSSAASGCRTVPAPQPKPAGHLKPPTTTLDASKKWQLTVATNCGSFTIALNLHTAPHASASMVALARSGFFNGTVFHRIVPGFVIQGGDPTGTGSGGPGYQTVDTPPANARYTSGVVAMAKTQTEPRGAAGSQFYVVTARDAQLPPDYALLGQVSQGMDVVQRIGQLGDPNSGEQGTPTAVVEISSVNVSSS